MLTNNKCVHKCVDYRLQKPMWVWAGQLYEGSVMDGKTSCV